MDKYCASAENSKRLLRNFASEVDKIVQQRTSSTTIKVERRKGERRKA